MKRLWKRLRDNELNNVGSALLTVILVVAFLTILATTLLYITGMNFQIKQADYRNKKNFYSGEVALEQIRAKLMEDVSEAGTEAYNEVMMNFVTLDNKDQRQLEFNKVFVECLTKEDPAGAGGSENGVWPRKLSSHGNNWVSLLTSYHTDGSLEMDNVYDLNGDGVFSSAEVLDIREADGVVRIKGLRMYYTDADGLTTIIYTDLDVYAPPIDWSAEGSLNALEAGVSDVQAARKNAMDVSRCVRYTNWRKE